jgi:myo-inositol-1(or 4)-monophosphatase
MEGSELRQSLAIAIKAARRAQSVFQKNAPLFRHVVSKSDREIKVNLDYSLETEILEELRESSDLPILSEESDHVREDGLWWIVDPLDGSLNWLRNIPFFSISIGLYRGIEPILGIVLDLVRDELYYGGKGLGAWLNDSPIRVSEINKKREAVLCTGFPSAYEFRPNREQTVESIYSEYLKVRMLGSAAMSLAYVARGTADVYWEEHIKLWDVAGGIALVQAAGGSVGCSTINEDFILSVEAGASSNLLPKGVTE